jgi:hypothetical protein
LGWEPVNFAAREITAESFSREGAKNAKDHGNLRELRVFRVTLA